MEDGSEFRVLEDPGGSQIGPNRSLTTMRHCVQLLPIFLPLRHPESATASMEHSVAFNS